MAYVQLQHGIETVSLWQEGTEWELQPVNSTVQVGCSLAMMIPFTLLILGVIELSSG